MFVTIVSTRKSVRFFFYLITFASLLSAAKFSVFAQFPEGSEDTNLQ